MVCRRRIVWQAGGGRHRLRSRREAVRGKRGMEGGKNGSLRVVNCLGFERMIPILGIHVFRSTIPVCFSTTDDLDDTINAPRLHEQ